jgi:FkbM family methyltransferase
MSPVRNIPFYLYHSQGLKAKVSTLHYLTKKICQKIGFYKPTFEDLSCLILDNIPIHFHYISPEVVFFKEIFIDRVYEQHADFIPKPGWVILDVGANIGLFALRNSRRIENGKIFCAEPNPFVYQILIQNIKNNRLNNVYAYETAIGEKSGTTNFIFSERSTGSGMISHYNNEIMQIPLYKLIVNINTLDDFIENNKIFCNIELIKLDIEGAELAAINGGLKLLERTERIVMEVHGKTSVNELKNKLDNFGFELVLQVKPNILYFSKKR